MCVFDLYESSTMLKDQGFVLSANRLKTETLIMYKLPLFYVYHGTLDI